MKTTQTTFNACPASYWNGSSRNGWGFILNNTANKILFQGWSSAALRMNALSTSDVNTGNWVHILGNYNRNSGASNELFINGTSEATATSSASWTTANVNFWFNFGDNPDPFWPSFVGDIAKAGHWNVNLDAAEIAALSKGFDPRLIRPSALLHLCPMVRETHELRHGRAAVLTGTTVSDHPRILGGTI
jgi:hypothetical protein